METDKERLDKINKFVTELMNKERYYRWTVFDVLAAVKQCVLLGITKFPKEAEAKRVEPPLR